MLRFFVEVVSAEWDITGAGHGDGADAISFEVITVAGDGFRMYDEPVALEG
jgi:hypothetical protein